MNLKRKTTVFSVILLLAVIPNVLYILYRGSGLEAACQVAFFVMVVYLMYFDSCLKSLKAVKVKDAGTRRRKEIQSEIARRIKKSCIQVTCFSIPYWITCLIAMFTMFHK